MRHVIQLVAQLQDWCQRAEASGIKTLQEFSLRLRSYALRLTPQESMAPCAPFF